LARRCARKGRPDSGRATAHIADVGEKHYNLARSIEAGRRFRGTMAEVRADLKLRKKASE
jgi:hypothetical protein